MEQSLPHCHWKNAVKCGQVCESPSMSVVIFGPCKTGPSHLTHFNHRWERHYEIVLLVRTEAKELTEKTENACVFDFIVTV